MWSQVFEQNLNCALNVLLQINFFERLLKLAFIQTFFQSTFKAQLKFVLQNLGPHFQNSFVPTCFMFYVLGSRIQHKKAIEN